MADILKLTALHLAGDHRQTGVLALQGLHAGKLIGADDPLALGIQGRRLPIHGADVLDLAIEVGIPRRGQPIAPPMRLERPLFKRRAAWRSEISATMPRRLISSAISRPVHWLMGRPEHSGASQASAMILATCASVMRTGLPERGASIKRSSTLRSSSVTACKPSQR